MTSLQKQLAVIAATSTHQLDLKAQKLAHGKSLLFDAKVAAAQSFESLHLICHEGYRDLCALDPRFARFSSSLFSEQSKVEDRTQMTQKENARLDGVLEAFLTMVGPRLLLKPAEKALEWLVRRFRVHEYNTETLVFTYLPYHTAPQFRALLAILPPNPGHTLRFLHPYIQSPTEYPPRRTIVYTAVNTPAFFKALQNHVIRVLEAGHQGPSLLSFWSSVTTQAIDAILDKSRSGRKPIQGQKTEDVLLQTLPVLDRCMRISTGPEAVTACYMIIIVLVSKAPFEDKVLDSLMEAAMLSQESGTLDPCLTCLAVLAEERSDVQLPPAILNRLLRIPNLRRTLVSLSKRCRVDRLTLGCALGALRGIGESEEKQQIFREIIDAQILDEPQMTILFSALLQVVREDAHGSVYHGELIEYVSKLSEEPAIAQIVKTAAAKSSTDLESLGLMIESPTHLDENRLLEDEDEEMLDVNDDRTGSVNTILPPEIVEISFLDPNASSFKETLAAFQQAVTFKQTSRFLSANVLQRKNAVANPLYLSFLVRVWCGASIANTRCIALHAATAVIGSLDQPADLQNLIPYLLYALSDSSANVRRYAATLVAALSKKTSNSKSSNPRWGESDLYGKDTKILHLTNEQLTGLLSALDSIREECVMDAKLILTSLRETLEGSQPTNASRSSLKSTFRGPVIAFIGSHIAATPVLGVRLRLLSLLKLPGKAMTSARVAAVLPVVRTWCSLSNKDVQRKCENEQTQSQDADRAHIDALLPKEADSMNLLREVVSGKFDKERSQLVQVVFDWINAHWKSIRPESRLSLSQDLLDLALRDNDTSFDELCRSASLQTLRNVNLDTAALISFIDSVPSAAQLPEGPPAKKRRRTSRNEIVRADAQSPEDISRLLRRLTLVLELIEASTPGERPELFKSLFAILGDLQPLRQQSGSDLVYLQGLILGSLTPMVNHIKQLKVHGPRTVANHDPFKKQTPQKDPSDYQESVRAELLVDCVRHSTSPQVQNAALLLISSLASWVPEMILHNLMPIFTFIGSTLLRQQDDYSAHVVDQTISRVVPQLASSLRAKQKNFLSGVADLLLSFTAAFEHIPQHRRLKLFAELARTLGPEDAASAILALLVDRYPNSKGQQRFSVELLLVFDPIVTLQAFKGYLDLVEDAAGSKRKVAETLFSLNEKQPSQVESVLYNLLSSLADFATDERLQFHVGKTFRKSTDPSRPRAIFATIVETIIRVSKTVAKQQKLYQACSRVLGRCLSLLPTTDLVKSSELLLSNPDHEVRIAAVRAVEVRAGTVKENDQTSVTSLVAFLPSLDETLQKSQDLDVKRVVLSCIESTIARFGKKDAASVSSIAETVSGSQALSSNDDKIRILSLLCLISVIDVLEDEAISLLPTVLPVALEYLGMAIEDENTGLHNAVYAFLTNVVQRLGYMFSREYLEPVLKLSQQSASRALEEACDEERVGFHQSISQHLEAQEVFSAIKSVWTDAVAQGPEALDEQLDLIRLTIEAKTKPQLVKASSTLFSLLLEAFKLRDALAESKAETDDDDVEQLEDSLVQAVLAMTLKLNDATFRPFFVQLVDLAAASSMTFYKFLAAFFDKFKSIVTNYSSYILDSASKLLASIAEGKEDSPLRTSLLLALQTSFLHDQDGFWTAPSHFSTILTPLLAQLTLPSSSSPAIAAICDLAAASTSSTDNHRDMNAILLEYMRAQESHTRLHTVLCEQELFKKLGEEWLDRLPELLPIIAELRDDDDEMVERETQRWISIIEGIFGESLDGMLE
ncbi:U3 small nucleolar RNA-associated protein 10 [Massarina eburnea CBS 473.64]|uniref:U3 small nucleolar RNA-associated protein 10 n=1 Tax=Massarina eburnea CBS 473.64 TaxID=1395130 RepID=A0A6A6S1V2_9PLEO|nr:U3 small nucleolar RNA-associated protein 10 [Massarina eburnea CBS 473.64]